MSSKACKDSKIADDEKDFGWEEKDGDNGATLAEPKEEVVFQSHLEALIAYCGGDEFQDKLDAFKSKHARRDLFLGMAECKEPEREELSLEFTDVFKEYTALIEKSLEDFADAHDIGVQELYFQARDAMDGKFTALFEEHEHKWFVDLLMEWGSFDHFFQMMMDASRKQQAEHMTGKALTMYRSMLRNASRIEDYNFRSYFVRKIRKGFREQKDAGGAAAEDALKTAQDELDMLKRIATVSQLYPAEKTILG